MAAINFVHPAQSLLVVSEFFPWLSKGQRLAIYKVRGSSCSDAATPSARCNPWLSDKTQQRNAAVPVVRAANGAPLAGRKNIVVYPKQFS
jgi:hypothetical protein